MSMTSLFGLFAPAFLTGLLVCPAKLTPDTFGVESKNGVWWLSAPGGQRLWSLGVDCVGIGDKGKPDNPNYDGIGLFGSNEAWAADTTRKFHAWGINTLGGWSQPEPFRGQFPYTEVLHLGSYDKAPWHDLFSTESKTIIAKAAADLIPKHRDDPKLIGYFTDNELGWWDDTLFITYFGFKKGAPGKLALVESIRKTYGGNYSAFLREWKTDATSFEDLAATTKIWLKAGTSGIRAVHDFNFKLASEYYREVHDLVRRYDPSHLILGDRYCQYYNMATAEASAPWTDVTSTNAGADWTDGTYSTGYFESLYALTGKPLMVTEFYFSANQNQSGNRNTGNAFPKVETQEMRGSGFANCLRQLAGIPYVVGAHWFQFSDEPPKGRGDGEDWNFGLVDVKGRTYSQMESVLKGFHADQVHQSTQSLTKHALPVAPRSPLADHLKSWDRLDGRLRSASKRQWADLYACRDASSLYLGLVPMEYGDANLYESGKIPEVDRPLLKLKVGNWTGTVRYGFSKKASLSTGIASCSERPGLKHILALQIPFKSFGKPLHRGSEVRIQAVLVSHGRGYEMKWDENLRCE